MVSFYESILNKFEKSLFSISFPTVVGVCSTVNHVNALSEYDTQKRFPLKWNLK